jgi:hypothetical protein
MPDACSLLHIVLNLLLPLLLVSLGPLAAALL